MAASGGGGNYTLSELVDLSLCSPEIGAVNFNILHRLLHAILTRLEIAEFRIHVADLHRLLLQPSAAAAADSKFTTNAGLLKVPTPTVKSTSEI